jgi:hypothetical protein
MAGHLRQHSFTGNTDHDFTGLGSNYLPKLNSSGTGITDSQIYDNGTNIGIGTTSPISRFHVMSTLNDGIKVESIQSAHHVLVSPGNNSFGPNITSSYTLEVKTPSAELRLGRTGGTGNALIYVDSSITTGLNISANAGGSPNLTLLSNGNVGAGTSNPLDKIHINNGTLRINDTGSTYGAGKLAVSDANGSISFSSTTALGLAGGSGTVGGTGTTNYVSKWASSTALTNSIIYDDGTNVGIGTGTTTATLHVVGSRADSLGNTFRITNSASTNTFLVKDNGVLLVGNITEWDGFSSVQFKKSGYIYQESPQGYKFNDNSGTGGFWGVQSPSNNLLTIERFGIGVPMMTFDSNLFKVGVFTSTPTAQLHLRNATYTDGFRIESVNGTDLIFDSTGKLGINTPTPTEKLHVSGGTIRIQTVNGTEGAGKFAISDANGSISFSSATALGLITSAGTVNKYTVSTSLTAGTVSYITHGLGLADATDAVVQMWSGNNLTLGAEISAVTTNQIAVTTSVSGTYKIVVLG